MERLLLVQLLALVMKLVVCRRPGYGTSQLRRTLPVRPGTMWTFECPNMSHVAQPSDRLVVVWSLNGRVWLKIDDGRTAFTHGKITNRTLLNSQGRRFSLLLNAGRYRFGYDEPNGDFHLTIDRVRQTDEGTWQCHVELYGSRVEQWVTHATLQLTTSARNGKSTGPNAFYYDKAASPRRNGRRRDPSAIYIDRTQNGGLASSRRRYPNRDAQGPVTFQRMDGSGRRYYSRRDDDYSRKRRRRPSSSASSVAFKAPSGCWLLLAVWWRWSL